MYMINVSVANAEAKIKLMMKKLPKIDTNWGL